MTAYLLWLLLTTHGRPDKGAPPAQSPCLPDWNYTAAGCMLGLGAGGPAPPVVSR